MKALTEKTSYVTNNDSSRPITVERQRLIIEDRDVGLKYLHFQGYCYRSWTFDERDVGRVIEQFWYEGYTSWVFLCKKEATKEMHDEHPQYPQAQQAA